MKILDVKQGSPEWLRARLGKITGTRLGSVMGGKQAQETLIYELIAEQLSGQAESVWVSQAMQWGVDHEDEAVDLYIKRSKRKNKPERVGFCISEEFPYLGLSPDRLIKQDKKYTVGVEVKCPTTKTAIKYRAEGGVPKEYKWQIVNYFLVCENLKSLDFVVYDPRIIKENNKLSIFKVNRRDVDNDIDAAKARLVEFRSRWKEIYKLVNK